MSYCTRVLLEQNRVFERLDALQYDFEDRDAREEGLDAREAELLVREREVAGAWESIKKAKAGLRLELEKERVEFWMHQQKLSAVVAGETEALVRDQERLRDEFEAEAPAARAALRKMGAQVESLLRELQGVEGFRAMNLGGGE